MPNGEGDEASWYVVHTQRHKERAAQVSIEQDGLLTYLPLLRQWPRPAVGAEVGPMFPSYVFVRAAATDFHRIDHTAGVHGLVTFGGEPATLDDSVVMFLREREGPDGTIVSEPLPAGCAVRIMDGPLRGMAAILERRLSSKQRVLVLLEILQREARVEMPERWVRQA